ncbi:MAG TPA: hypothetical protein VJR87_04515 [Allosphingosinicella sp.]|nr:hypothetical protein [Allosphingosinicella sp.]
MQFNRLTVAFIAASLIATPSLAAGSGAAAAPARVAPPSEQIGQDGQQIYGASVILQIGVVVLGAVALYFLIDQLKGNDKPASP